MSSRELSGEVIVMDKFKNTDIAGKRDIRRLHTPGFAVELG